MLAEDLNVLAREKHPECFSAIALTGKKYHFRKLEELPKSYARAFDGEISIVAEVENSDVRALGLLRHLLVHKSGKVDQKHIDERTIDPIVTQLDAFGLNSTVELTGVLVRKLADPVTERAFKLTKLVDSWIEAHKPT